jgi:hypothetical protein
VKSILVTLLAATTLVGCVTTHPVNTTPADEDVIFSKDLTPVKGPHWVVLRAKLNPSTGDLLDIDGANAKDAIDCLNKAHQITKDRIANRLAVPAEFRVCRQIGSDGMPLDEDKIDAEGKPLPKETEEEKKSIDKNTV